MGIPGMEEPSKQDRTREQKSDKQIRLLCCGKEMGEHKYEHPVHQIDLQRDFPQKPKNWISDLELPNQEKDKNAY